MRVQVTNSVSSMMDRHSHHVTVDQHTHTRTHTYTHTLSHTHTHTHMRAAGMEGDVGDISKRESTTEGSMYGGSEVRNAVHCSSGLSSKRASSNKLEV